MEAIALTATVAALLAIADMARTRRMAHLRMARRLEMFAAPR